MRESGFKTKCMAMVDFIMQMEPYTKVIGNTIKNMAKAGKLGLMDLVAKAIFQMVSRMVMDIISGPMVVNMRAIG